MRKAIRWALPLAAVPPLALLGFGLTRDVKTLPSALVGAPAPEFRLEDMYDASDSLSLVEHRGRVVVLNYWASWCAPCIVEHPELVRLRADYDADDLTLLGVLYQDAPERGREFMRRHGGEWPSVVDYGSRTAIRYGVYGVPETFLISPEGTVVYKLVGPLDPRTAPVFRARIDSLLAVRAAGGSGVEVLESADGSTP